MCLLIVVGAVAGTDPAAGGAGDVTATGFQQAEAEGGGEPGGEATQHSGLSQSDSF